MRELTQDEVVAIQQIIANPIMYQPQQTTSIHRVVSISQPSPVVVNVGEIFQILLHQIVMQDEVIQEARRLLEIKAGGGDDSESD